MKIVNSKNGFSVKKSFRRYFIVSLLSLAFFFAVVNLSVAQDNSESCNPSNCNSSECSINRGIIRAITADQSSLQVQNQELKTVTVFVKKPELKTILQRFSKGDLVCLDYDKANNELTNLLVATSLVSGPERLVTLVFTGLLLYFITYFIVHYLCKKNLNEIFVGKDKRLSNSKSQMAIWFFVLLVGYVSLYALRVIKGGFGFGFVGGIDIPQNLLLLSGLSVLTYGGAKVITQSQVNSNPDSKIGSNDKPSLKDFVTDDTDNTDFGDLQMSFITLLAVVVYLLQLFNFLGTLELYRLVTLPDVDTTILSIFGLSQGAYLTKKAAVATGASEV